MSFTYKGNPGAAQSPAYAPRGGGIRPQGSLPDTATGFDPANLQQAFKEPLDYIACINSGQWTRYQELYLLPSSFNLSTSQNPFYSAGPPVISYCPLQFVSAGSGGSMAIQDPGAGSPAYSGKTVLLSPGYTPTAGAAYLATSSKIAPFLAGNAAQYFIAEFDVTFSAFSTSFTGTVGMADNANQSLASNYILLSQTNQAWSLSYKAGSYSVTTALGAAYNATASAFQRMRIEAYAAGTPEGIANGNTAFINCYVNDTLALSQTVTTFQSVDMFLGGGAAPTANATMTMGAFTAFWNRY